MVRESACAAVRPHKPQEESYYDDRPAKHLSNPPF